MINEVVIGGAIVAIVQAFKTQFPQVTGLVTIILAAVLGVLAGLAGLGGLNWVTGLIIGLTSVGVITTATKIGGVK